MISPVKSTSISVDEDRRHVKEGFLSLETIETWIVYLCHSEGEWARQNILSAFEQGMVADWWAFPTQQFPVCIKNSPPPKGNSTDLTQLWEALHGPESL